MKLGFVSLVGLVLLAGCSQGALDADPEPEGGLSDSIAVNAAVRTCIPGDPSSWCGEPGVYQPNATVESVIDGDTIEVAIMGEESETVRLLGIDTPETVDPNRPEQCYGAEASLFLERLLPAGTPVTLILDVESRDSYGRTLAYVIRSGDGGFVNLEMVASGHAAVLYIEPNRTFKDQMSAAETNARSAGLGLWGACGGPDVPLN